MRTGFKWLIAILVLSVLVMVLGPIVAGWFVMM